MKIKEIETVYHDDLDKALKEVQVRLDKHKGRDIDVRIAAFDNHTYRFFLIIGPKTR